MLSWHDFISRLNKLTLRSERMKIRLSTTAVYQQVLNLYFTGKVTVRALLMKSCVWAGPDFGVCCISGQVSSGFVELEG